MPIEYKLVENPNTRDPTDFTAVVLETGCVDLKGLIEKMREFGCVWPEDVIEDVLQNMIMASEVALQEGQRVRLDGLVELFPRICGVFDGADDHFDPRRHLLDVGCVAGARIRRTVRDRATAGRVEGLPPSPFLQEFMDLGSETKDSLITPGNIGIIHGWRLKFNQHADDEGVVLIPTEKSSLFKVEQIQCNKMSELVFVIPDYLPQGDYELEVRARLDHDPIVRAGRLGVILSAL
jgi:hypothetical protein